MLEKGHRLAAEHNITNIAWREGDSTTLPAMDVGPVLLTLMGASHHWMDRERVAQDLDRIIEPGGATVLASGGAPGDLEPAPWRQVVDNVRTRHLGPQRRAGSGTYTHPKERHQDVLARSPFSHVDTTRWDRTLTRTVDEVIGWASASRRSSPPDPDSSVDSSASVEADPALTPGIPDVYDEHVWADEAVTAVHIDQAALGCTLWPGARRRRRTGGHYASSSTSPTGRFRQAAGGHRNLALLALLHT